MDGNGHLREKDAVTFLGQTPPWLRFGLEPCDCRDFKNAHALMHWLVDLVGPEDEAGKAAPHVLLRHLIWLHEQYQEAAQKRRRAGEDQNRDPLTNRPYIPGSSLKGKIRSLLEKYNGLQQNQRIGQGFIHSCDEKRTYKDCNVCQVFGVPGERDFATPTRLVMRDMRMSQKSAEELDASGRTDLPYTEVKVEVSIDRVTPGANPRQMERVPAGTIFQSESPNACEG